MSRKIAKNKVLGILRATLIAFFFLAYPYLIYRGMDSGLVWLAPALFSAIYIYQAMHISNQRLKAIKLLIAAVLLLGAFFLQALAAKLIPIFVQLMLMHFFGRTLINGPTLVERFVRFDYPEYPPTVVVYARQLTLMWTCFFAFNALMCAVLALWAPDAWWAIYNGVMIYTLTGMLMVGEYIYRHFRFPDWEIPSIKTTMQNMIVNGRGIWIDVHSQK